MEKNHFFILLLLVSSACCSIVNKEIIRIVDATTPVVRVYLDIKASNVKNEYDIYFSDSVAKSIAYVSATSGKEKLIVNEPISDGNHSIFTIQMGDLPSSTITPLQVSIVMTGLMFPYPAVIAQGENQFFMLKDNHYFFSPYRSESQKTTFKLASSGIESYTRLAPSTNKGSQIVFGPYNNIAPLSVSVASIHFSNNGPCAKFSGVNREFEVSHWGQVFVEEVYELHHCGASLSHGFSRLDYQSKSRGGASSFRSLVTKLPSTARGIYYRDQIGNISTSELHALVKKSKKTSDKREAGDAIELEIETRFPMFGGWQVQFYLGYSVPASTLLRESGRAVPMPGWDSNFSSWREYVEQLFSPRTYQLEVEYAPGFDNVWTEDLETKVILPEGSTHISVRSPYPVTEGRSRRFTYLDSEFNGGRPVIVLRANNVVPDHKEVIIVSYSFQPVRMLIEPLMLTAAVATILFICIGYGFFQDSIMKLKGK